MATSGSCETSKYNSKKWVRFDWTRESYISDASACRSGIYFEMYGVGTDSSWHYAGPINVWINRTSGTPDFTFWANRGKLYNGTFIGSGRFNIDHDTDGSGEFSVYIEAAIYSNSVNCYGSGYWQLDSLPRQANITGAIDFNSNANPYMEFNNPGGLTCNLRLEFGGTSISRNGYSGYGGGYTFALTEAERQLLYSKCPNSTWLTVRYVVATLIDGVETWWSYVDKTMYVVNSNPIFSNFNYEDRGGVSTQLTGNNQIVINGFNEVRAIIPVVNRAIAQNGATIVKYRAVCGNIVDEKVYSASADVVLSLDYIKDRTITVYAIDSRGNSTPVSEAIADWKDYFNPVIASANAARQNGVGTETTLTFSGRFWKPTSGNDFGAVPNVIEECYYQYKKTNESNYGEPIDITPTISGNTFRFSSTIKGDAEAEGFNLSNSFNIQITMLDKIRTTTYDVLLGAGTPAMAIHRDGVAFGGQYDEGIGGSFQSYGKSTINGHIPHYSDTIEVFDNSQIIMEYPTAWEHMKLPLKNYRSTGSAFTFDSANNRVILNKSGIIDIDMHINVYSVGYVNGDYIPIVRKNGSGIGAGPHIYVSGDYLNYYSTGGSIYGIVCNVGDVFDMSLATSGIGNIRTFAGDATSFTLKYRRS